MGPSIKEDKGKSSQSASGQSVKKRTIYRQKSLLELPEWAKEDTKHKFRWVSKRRVARSDGFDPRGWEIAKSPEGETLEAFDSVLYKMPLDEWEAMKEFKDKAARENVEHVLESIESQHDRLRYEIASLGSRIGKTEFSLERKI